MRVAIPRTGVVLPGDGARSRRCCRRSSWASAARWPAGASTCRGCTSTTSSAALLFLLDGGRGTYNVTAPEPVTNRELSKALGRALKPPAVRRCPRSRSGRSTARWRWIVTTGVRAVPKRLMDEGYAFGRPDLDDALRAAVG